MHVRVRLFGQPDCVVVVESRLTKIEQFRRIIKDKFDVVPNLQRLFYGGKLLENGYTFHDYNIKLNDVIQLMVRALPQESPIKKESPKTDNNVPDNETCDVKIQYKDAESSLYTVGEFIDMKDRESGAWLEGKITRIVYDPNSSNTNQDTNDLNDTDCDLDQIIDSDTIEAEESATKSEEPKAKSKGIAKYFSKTPKIKIRSKEIVTNENAEDHLLFKVQLDADEEDSDLYCKLKEIRPRARTAIDIQDLKVSQTVMVNHNIDDPTECGYWYDFQISEIKKLRSNYQLVGTLYLGPQGIPQNNTLIRVQDKVYAIEEAVPIQQRSEEYKALLANPPEPRTHPPNCFTCRDKTSQCQDCGCYLCRGKESPEKIVLCDECNRGYHMQCLTPPLLELPDDDWYCPDCKRDSKDVIAPGAAKQNKKVSTTKRDWGRGMACVGKTKTCAMPPNHFGPIPGIEVGMCWRYRIQLSESGVHRPPVSGIHGRDVDGAYSIVLSGGYEDDVDYGNEFTYTGSGGRDLSGNKRTAEQSCDQTLTRENRALARNCAVKTISEDGGDAGDDWKHGKPVRVVRSYKMLKHYPKYAPKEGIRYDGIYKVVKYYPEKGLSGYRVWKYLLRRDDPSPAPWEPEAKQYTIIYPDGYLEAEAEKKALKAKNTISKPKSKPKKKRQLSESNDENESGESPPLKKRKTGKQKQKRLEGSLTPKISNIFVKSPKLEKKSPSMEIDKALTVEETDAINADTLNSKLWSECLEVCSTKGKKEFVEFVTESFVCIICQSVTVTPVTTPCLHNFCMGCLKTAFSLSGVQCPCCRQSLTQFELEPNEQLRTALRTILTGYDVGKK